MNTVMIREVNGQDWRELGVVSSQSYRETYNGIIPETYIDTVTVEERQNYFQRALRDKGTQISIMEINDKAIGYIEVKVSNESDSTSCAAEIHSLYTLKDYWGNGYGGRLISWEMQKLHGLGYSKVTLWVLKENANARSFYSHIGFTSDGAERIIRRGIDLMQVRYERQLNDPIHE